MRLRSVAPPAGRPRLLSKVGSLLLAGIAVFGSAGRVAARPQGTATADLRITKSAPSFVDPNDTLTYTIRVSNQGPGTASGVRIADTLPANAVFLDAPGGVRTGRIVTWPVVASLAPGAQVTFSVRVIAPPCNTVVTNVATVAAAGPADPDPASNYATATTRTIEGPPCTTADLRVTKAGPATASPGDTIVYTIRVENRGPGIASGVGVTDALPAEGAFVSASAGGTADGGTVSWPQIASLPAGGTAVFEVRFEVGALTGPCPEIRNVASAVASSKNDPSPNDNTSQVLTQVSGPACGGGADLEIVKEGPATVPRLPLPDSFEYRLRVVNLGPDTARNVEVQDALPAAGVLVRVSGGGVVTGRLVTWHVSRLAPGDTLRYSVWYRWPVSAAEGGSITNTAVVRSGPGDRNPANDTSRVVTTAEPSLAEPDLEVVKSGPASVAGGDTIGYTIRVRNLGSGPASGVLVADSLPAGVVFEAATGGAVRAGRLLTWSLPTLGPGDSATFAVRVRAPPAVCGQTLVNVAAVSAASADADASNDRSVVATEVGGAACGLVELRKTASPGTFRPGATGTFRLTVVNRGAIAAGPLTVTDTLAAGLSFVSGSGTGWAVSGSGPVVTAVFAGTVAPGDSAGFDITVAVSAGALPQVCNRAFLEADGQPGNGPEAEASVCVPVGEPHLLIEKTASRPDAEVGETVDYRLTVILLNTGLPNVAVTDALPPGFRYVPRSGRVDGRAVPDPEGSPGPTLVFRLGDLAPGDTVKVSYRVRIGVGTPIGPGVNRARAQSGSDQSNEARATVAVRAGPFSDDATIAGKVFLDSSAWTPTAGTDCRCLPAGDRAQSPPEFGIARVRVWLQDGTSALTDSEGRFLFYGLRPRTWVVKVDRATLPPGAVLLPLSNRHARDGASLLVDLKAGELHRADFAVASAAGPLDLALLERRNTAARDLARLEAGPVEAFGSRGATRNTQLFTQFVPLLPDPLGGTLDRIIRGTGGLPERPAAAGAGPPAAGGPAGGPLAAVVGDTVTRGSDIALGLLEARIDFRSLADGSLGFGRPRDRFEDRLRSLGFENDEGRVSGGARGALFYRGVVRGSGVTVRLDTEEDESARLFRDIRPEAFYPVSGDASIREFDAASRGRLFGRIERGVSFLGYGDFSTSAGSSRSGSRLLGEYGRSLTGAVQHFENGRAALTAFASHDRSAQVVDVIAGAGVSGPYALSRRDGLANSERVELVTRDRTQPAVVLLSEPLERFTDYTIEPFTGRILFRRPVPGVDRDLNPVEIRVTYEVEAGGDRFWIWGANGQLRPAAALEVGGGFVRDDNPAAGFDLASVNATLGLGPATWLTGEFARTDSAGAGSGDAGRLELRHAGDRAAGRLFLLDTEPAFANPSAAFGRGRREIGFFGAASAGERNRLFTEFLRTTDRVTGAGQTGGRVGLERDLRDGLHAQLSFRHAAETGAGSSPEASPTNAIGVRLAADLPGTTRGSAFAEFEQDASETDRRRAAVGGDYRVIEGVRLYARHELLSSLAGPWLPAPGAERNTTVLGVAAENRSGQAVFSEYRIAGAVSGRDAEAAIGLRNSWTVRDGVRLGASVERLAPIGSGGRNATALAGSAEFTGSPLWKGSTRLEYRDAGGTDNLFGSLGFARKLSPDFTLLATSAFSAELGAGERAFARSRIGIAWRQTERNRWNALARYEHRLDRDAAGDEPGSTRTAHILSAHLDFRPDPALILRGQAATKSARTSSPGSRTSEATHLLGARATLDLGSRFDAGLLGRSLFATSPQTANRWGAGAEIGFRAADGLRMAAGYNAFGFHDRELSFDESTDRGPYIQIGMTLDADQIAGRANPACPCPQPTRPRPTTPDTVRPGPEPLAARSDLAVVVAVPARVAAGETFLISVITVNLGRVGADSVETEAELPAGLEFVDAAAGVRRMGSAVRRAAGSIGVGKADTLVMLGTATGTADSLVVAARSRTVTPETSLANNAGVGRIDVAGMSADTADLYVRISGPFVVPSGDTLAYEIVRGNRGPDGVRSAVLTGRLPEGTALERGTAGLIRTAGGVRWIGLLGAGAEDTLRLVVRDDTTGGARARTVALAADVGSPVWDPDAGNNARQFETGIVPRCGGPGCGADIMVSIWGPREAGPEDEVVYGITSRNLSRRDAEDVSLRAQLPAAATRVEAVGAERVGRAPPEPARRGPAAGGSGLTEPGPVASRETLRWRGLGTLVADTGGGGRTSVTRYVRLSVPPGSHVTEAWTETVTPEANLENNHDRIGLEVPGLVIDPDPEPPGLCDPSGPECVPEVVPPEPEARTDLAVAIRPVARSGHTVTYLVTTTNLGALEARDVRVHALWPAGVEYRSSSGTARVGGAGAGWPGRFVLESGSSLVDTLVIHVLPVGDTIERRLTLEAGASTISAEPDISNNRAVTLISIQEVIIRDTTRIPPTPGPVWPAWWPWVVFPLLAAVPVLLFLIWRGLRLPALPGPRSWVWPPRDTGPGPRLDTGPGPFPGPQAEPEPDSGDEKDSEKKPDRPPGDPRETSRRPLWGMPIPMVPPVGAPVGRPDPDWTIPRACGRLELDGRAGIAWLADPDRFVTCAHLVQAQGRGSRVDIRFQGETLRSTVEALDEGADVAVLRLPDPLTDVQPLRLATTRRDYGRWEGFAWLDDGRGMWLGGAVQSGASRDRFEGPRMTVTGREFVERLVSPGHGLAGAPIVVGGEVVGHVTSHVPHGDSLDRAFSSLVYGAALPRIRKLLDREPAQPFTSAVPCPAALDEQAGERHHAFVVYRGADRAFANRLLTRLEGSGISLLPLQHERPGEPLLADEVRAREHCRDALLVFSRAWLGGNPADLERAAAGLKRETEGGRVLLIDTDGSAVPPAFADFERVEFRDAAPDHGAALRRLQLAFMPALDEAALDAWVTAEGVCDDIIRELLAARGVPGRLRFIARRWREAAVPGHHVTVLAAELLVEAGRPDHALEALAQAPRSIRARQVELLALWDLGRLDEVAAGAASLVAESVSDAVTGRLGGDVCARLWQESGHRRGAWRTRAFDAWLDCHRRSGDALAGARAAAMALEEEGVGVARQIASEVMAQLAAATDAQDAATAIAYGTACLVLGERAEARAAFDRAAALEPAALGRIAALPATIRSILDALRDEHAAAGDAKIAGLPAVAVFVAARDHGWHAWRPPAGAEAEETGRQRIREQLEAHAVGCAFCGLATEADLLFAEEVLAARGEVEIVLPFAREAFLDLWIPPALRSRVERLLADGRVEVKALLDAVPDADAIEAAVIAGTGEAERRARARAAEWDCEPLLFEVQESAGAGGPATRDGFRLVSLEEWRPEPATRDIRVKRTSAPSQEPREYRKRHLVVVGIDRYAEWPPLQNAGHDADGVAATLERDFGFEVRSLRDAEATADRIRELVTVTLVPEVADDDLVVFFFAGHGHTERADDGTDHGFLVPVEARRESTDGLLPMEEVVSWTRLLASDDVLYIFDSCFSGFAGMAESVTERGDKFDARIAITAGTTEQPVLDGGAPGVTGDHSIFTGYLLRGLTKDVAAAPGHPFNALSLFIYLQHEVDEATNGRQTPSCGFLHGHGIGNIWLQARTPDRK